MFEKEIIRRTLRVPASDGAAGDGRPVARQLDVALLDVGFSASRPLLEHIGALAPGPAMTLAATIVSAVRELVGDHVAHNAYFIGFPHAIPSTIDFWLDRLHAAVMIGAAPGADEPLNLLELPGYGTYQHTYADLLAVHDELITGAGDRVTALHLGGPAGAEAVRLYHELAASPVPLGEADQALLGQLAVACLDDPQPAEVPVRENRAVLNGVRLVLGHPLLRVDTVTDVLRLAWQVSGGDPSLARPGRLRRFRRAERRLLLAALDQVVAGSPAQLGDISRHAEPFKRLGERLHPHEYAQWPLAQQVFAVARGEQRVPSIAGRAESAFRAGEIAPAATVLAAAPGLLLRNTDRLLRRAAAHERDTVVAAVHTALGSASGRVLLSLREHLGNRLTPASARIYASRSRTAWIGPDDRAPLPAELVTELTTRLDAEIGARLPAPQLPVLIEPELLDIALPLSDGSGSLPRGSRTTVTGDVLRFFMYWRQRDRHTDYDLSLQLLDDDFHSAGQVSWTNYRYDGVVHSGDVTDAPDGATEFIDVPAKSRGRYVVPQVNVYTGETFDEVAESMFGYQTRAAAQLGAPFDARTVRARSSLRGHGRVALPIVFVKQPGGWQAIWLHLYLSGSPSFNRVEENVFGAAERIRALLERRYLTVAYLLGHWRATTEILPWTGEPPQVPVTYLGLHAPADLPPGSRLITPDRLATLIPA